MIAKGTIEEKIVKLQETKKEVERGKYDIVADLLSAKTVLGKNNKNIINNNINLRI